MAEKRKSIIDEALLESEQVEQAFKANAKEVLARTMSSEIEEFVKESLEGSIGLTEDDDEEMDLDLDLGDDEEDMDAGLDAGDDLDLELGDMEMGDLDLDDEGDMEMDDLEVVDLTGEDDETVVNVFKKMAPEDEIEVVQTGDGVEIKDNETGAEYRIELGGGEMEDEDEMDIDFEDEEMEDEDDMELDLDLDLDDEDEMEMDDDMNEEIVYEVEIDVEEEDEREEDEVVDEDLAGTRGYRGMKGKRHSATSHHPKAKNESFTPRAMKLIKENKVLKNNVSKVQKENEQLKEDYNKMVDALKQFRTKLNEVAVFNSNLTYSVRLFTENTTTKEEKVDIIKRFDDVKSLKESKNVYKQLVSEISKKSPIKESVDKKLNVTKTSGSAETKINESQVYVNPELEKMKKLWEYEYKQ
jgi:hypothetical protein